MPIPACTATARRRRACWTSGAKRATRRTTRQNLLNFVNLTGTQFLSEHLLLSGNAYYRQLVTGSSNGNVNDNYLSGDYSGPPIDCTAPPASRADHCLLRHGPERRLAPASAHRRFRRAADRFAGSVRLEEPGHRRRGLRRLRRTRLRKCYQYGALGAGSDADLRARARSTTKPSSRSAAATRSSACI